MKKKKKFNIVLGIEMGLNIIAQDIIWKSNKEDIQNFINRFKFVKQDKFKNEFKK
jgi:hypothetical protein